MNTINYDNFQDEIKKNSLSINRNMICLKLPKKIISTSSFISDPNDIQYCHKIQKSLENDRIENDNCKNSVEIENKINTISTINVHRPIKFKRVFIHLIKLQS